MLHEQFQQNVANSIENERFELKNAANTLETAASSSKMLQTPPKCCKIYGKWKVPTPKYCKDSWNSKMLQIARKTGRKADPKKMPKTEKQTKQFRTLLQMVIFQFAMWYSLYPYLSHYWSLLLDTKWPFRSISSIFFMRLAIVEVVEAWSGWIHGCKGCRTNNLGYPWVISGFANWKITMFKGSITIVYHFFLWAMASIAMFPWPLEATGRNSATSEAAGRDNTLRSRVRLGTGERA